MKKIVYIDMDDTIVDFMGHWEKVSQLYPDLRYPQSLKGFFEEIPPLEFAVEAINKLRNFEELDVYILTAPSTKNPHCYTDKRLSIEKLFDEDMVERLIISPHKHLNKGDYLIDDNIKGKGQDKFEGKLIHFGSEKYPNWNKVLEYFESNYK